MPAGFLRHHGAIRVRALLLAACLAACGSSGGPAPAPPPPGPAASAPVLDVEAPGNGAVVRPGRVLVRGRAAPGAPVRVTADCEARCAAERAADSTGRFSVPLILRTRGESAAILVRSGGAATSVVVSVQRPRPARRVRPLARRKRRLTRAPERGRPAVPRPAPRPRRPPRTALVVGDSLAVGTAAGIPAALPGWRVRTDALTGRPLASGMEIIRAARPRPPVLAVSLFTNDDPRSLRALEAAVRETTGGGCAVWATIAAPPVGGVGYEQANELLRRLAAELRPRLQIVDWAADAAARPGLLAGDRVHGTPSGYAHRARAYAAAMRRCP